MLSSSFIIAQDMCLALVRTLVLGIPSGELTLHVVLAVRPVSTHFEMTFQIIRRSLSLAADDGIVSHDVQPTTRTLVGKNPQKRKSVKKNSTCDFPTWKLWSYGNLRMVEVFRHRISPVWAQL